MPVFPEHCDSDSETKSISQDPDPKVTSPLCTNPKKLQFQVAGCQVVGLPFGLRTFAKLKQVGERERETL